MGFPARPKRHLPGAIREDTGTNVILFWLSGGPGHMETWEPIRELVG